MCVGGGSLAIVADESVVEIDKPQEMLLFFAGGCNCQLPLPPSFDVPEG